MTATMDIVVCFDYTSSIAADFKKLCKIILSILSAAVTCEHCDVRIALIKFWTHYDSMVTQTHDFTRSMDVFRQWLNEAQPESGAPDGTEAIGESESRLARSPFLSFILADAMRESLMLNWRSSDGDHWHEKLVILITDGPPCGLLGDRTKNDVCACGEDVWKLADEFDKKNIILAVVGVEPCVLVCEDFYCALANKTGGEYLPMNNAARVLSTVVRSAIINADTLTQLFHRLDMEFDIEYNSMHFRSYIQERIRFMAKHCHTMGDIRKLLFTYRSSVVDPIKDDEPHFPSSNMLAVNQLSYRSVSDLTSTPTTDDEGYRSRLPTSSSSDSSAMFIVGSPVLQKYLSDLVCTTEDEDDCF